MAQPVITRPGRVNSCGNTKFDPAKLSGKERAEREKFLRTNKGKGQIGIRGGGSKFF